MAVSENTVKSQAGKNEKSAVRENVEAILIAIILALFIRTFIVQAFKIPSGSMLETLQIGDHILVNKFIYGVKIPFSGRTIIPLGEPKRKDIIVFKYPMDPSKDFIKRVVAVGGDRVAIRGKQVYVNGKPVTYEHAIYRDGRVLPGPRDNMPEITVPKDSLFVMGDNRDNSHDSRFWGFVDLQNVKGKAFIVYWSWNSNGFDTGLEKLMLWKHVRWDRIGHWLE